MKKNGMNSKKIGSSRIRLEHTYQPCLMLLHYVVRNMRIWYGEFKMESVYANPKDGKWQKRRAEY